jgi:hypothetical protein
MLGEQAMKALLVVLLTVLVAACHFDKLFNDSGGSAASRGGSGPPVPTHLIFLTQPSDAAAGATIAPPVRVAAEDDQDRVVATFSGTISIAIGQDGSLLGGARLNGTTNVAAVNGIATFADLSIDQPGVSDYTLVARSSPLVSAQSAPFKVTGP